MPYKILSMIDSENSPACITPWSLIHFISGIMTIIVNKLFIKIKSYWNIIIVYNIIHGLYELKDYSMTKSPKVRNFISNYISKTVGRWSINNTILNSICDQLLFWLGLIAAYYIFYIRKIKFKKRQYFTFFVMYFMVILLFLTNENLD